LDRDAKDLAGNGVQFEGNPDACWRAGLIYGDSINGVVGSKNLFLADMKNQVPFSFNSNANFDQITTCQMTDSLAPIPFNMQVTQTTYSNAGDDNIFIKYLFLNNSGNNYSDLYFGIFCDWDVGNAFINRGGIDESRNLIYQWENGGASDSNYYGIVAFTGLDGGTVTDSVPLSRITDYIWLTVINPPAAMDLEYRTYIGDGPYNLSNGDSVVVGFGVVAGNNLADLQANTENAQSKWENFIVSSVEDFALDIIPAEFSLAQNYPNPFNPSTTISYHIPELSFVTLKVYDVLGNEIATLVNGEKPAGSYELKFDATNLPSGIFFYKLHTDSFVEAKKMVLMK
jgi:hypothetical protein